MEIKSSWKKLGYANEPIPEGTDLKKEIRRLCKEKNAIIMAHYYTIGDLQDIADFVGDSLALAQKAATTDADVIVMCGVHFMAETNKILCPDKTVLIPDLNASCSLAESCPADEFADFVAAHPDHKVVSYINSITGREMLLWDGACHVHERFSVEKLVALKKEHPDAKVLVHPECKGAIVKLADVVGSTARLLKYATESADTTFLVVTESGILHQMQKACPEKTFIPVPPDDATCACNECNFMRLNTLEKVYNALKFGWPTVDVPKKVAERAVRPINKMLEISERLGL